MMLDEADICKRIMQLEEDVTVPLTNTAMESYEEFEKAITRIMLLAEKMRKNYLWGEYHSPKLSQHLNLINYWRLIIRKKQVY